MMQRINFNKKTVFVVGAGASLPYGYPLGAELVNKVIKAAEKRNDDKAKELVKLIKFHDPLSIDSFLAQHCAGEENKDLRNIGKQLIAEQILSCEDRDAISKKGQQIVYNKEAKSYERGNENWYRYLAHAMFEDKERLINEPLPFKIITFNYDVSLDYYLLERVWQAFEGDKETAKKILLKLKDAIIHVYGKVREVPWDNPEVLDNFKLYLDELNDCYIGELCLHANKHNSDTNTEKTHMPYVYGSHFRSIVKTRYPQENTSRSLAGSAHGQEFITKAAKRIHVIGEEREKVRKLLQPFKQYIAEEAERIMFLGFGFDNQNMDLLFDNGIQTLFSADYLKFISDELGISKESIEICYTNYGDSEKLNRRIEEYFPEDRFKHFKSTKSVYEALTQDFDLD